MSANPRGGQAVTFVERLTTQLDRYAARPRPSVPAEQDGSDQANADAASPSPSGDAAAAAESTPAELAAFTDELRAASTWSGPPVALRDLVMAAVRAEAAGPALAETAPAQAEATASARAEATAEPDTAPAQPDATAAQPPTGSDEIPAPTPATAPRPARRAWRLRWPTRLRRLTWAVPVAALAAAAFTVGVLAVERALEPASPHTETFTAQATPLASGASAKIWVAETGSGLSVRMDFTGLPAAAPGSYYAAWLRGPQGSVPIGSFHERRAGTPIELWSGVDLADYPTLKVTLQAEGDPPTPSQLVVMTVSLTR